LDMHESYELFRKYPCDFRVKYRFLSKEEGGRETGTPYQGYRSDFWYYHPENRPNEIYCINPEFEDSTGDVITESGIRVPIEGTARMWILFPRMRAHHRGRIMAELKGYFMEGPKCVAECEVLEIVGLQTNPDS
jgi:hypothetical protein